MADAVQNGMAGEYRSVTEGLAMGATIIAWNCVIEYLEFYSLTFRRLLQGSRC